MCKSLFLEIIQQSWVMTNHFKEYDSYSFIAEDTFDDIFHEF